MKLFPAVPEFLVNSYAFKFTSIGASAKQIVSPVLAYQRIIPECKLISVVSLEGNKTLLVRSDGYDNGGVAHLVIENF
jgi:hypothetical protein